VINLLPPALKEEIAYSKRNRVLRSYLILTMSLVVVLAGALMGGRWYLNQQINATQLRIADKRRTTETPQYKDLQANAKKINDRLTAIQTIQKTQSKFSVLLNDLAQNMPQGAGISSLTLTGDDKHPVRMVVSAIDYQTASSVRDSITKSKRISAADIESIQGPGDSTTKNYQVTLSFAFNPGAAR
jgi:Tfp pilus assembly protein PilN